MDFDLYLDHSEKFLLLITHAVTFFLFSSPFAHFLLGLVFPQKDVSRGMPVSVFFKVTPCPSIFT